MSLKAKIEAVIYASEEPVTLAQLVGLLGEEGQAELDALRSQQTSLALEDATPAADADVDERPGTESGDQDALNAELLDTDLLDAESGDGDDAEPKATPADDAPSALATADGAKESAETVSEQEMTGQEAPVEPSAGSVEDEKKEDEKKLARTREKALREHFRLLLDQLIADYASDARGLEIREVAGGFRLATKPEYHDAVRGFVKSLKPPMKLSLQALETLAVVAYKQPVTAPEITEIRGVDSGGVLGGLLARKLIQTAGRKQVIGRPMLYKTSKEFLVRFGLKDINELPSIEEFEKMAGELADAEPVQEEIQMDHAPEATQEDATPEESAPAAVDERNSTPEPTTVLHATPEEILSDKSVAPEGHETEPGEEPLSEPANEPMADVHEPQSDGDSTPTAEETEQEGHAS